jgi:hypothetical protein
VCLNVQRKNLKNEIKKEDAIANIETPKDNFTVKVVEALAKRKSGSESVEMTGDIQEMTSEKERSLIEFAGTLDFAPQMKAQEKETENVIGADETERVLFADSLETDLSQNLEDDDVSPIAEEAPRSLSADKMENLVAQTAEEIDERNMTWPADLSNAELSAECRNIVDKPTKSKCVVKKFCETDVSGYSGPSADSNHRSHFLTHDKGFDCGCTFKSSKCEPAC